MTTTPPSAPRGENSGTVAVEWIASIAAAFGLLLCLLAAPGGELGMGGPADHGVERGH